MSGVESGPFEHDMAGDGTYLTSPAAKRARFEDPSEVDEVAQVTEIETVEEETVTSDIDHTVTITVPSSQFEIEINSQNDTSSPTEIGQIQTGDLAGPSFGIVHETQEISLAESQLPPEESSITSEDGSTLNAIGRALIQMQQGQQQQIAAAGSIPQSQLIFTRATSTDSDTAPPNGNTNAPLYVMIPPASSAEILQAMGQSRPIAPKSSVVATADLSNTDVVTADSLRKSREEQRKATHNEVERRRRDRINELIKVLAQVVPGCQKKDATTGNVVGYVYSKGTVLGKTVEYLKELMTQNEQLNATAKLAEKSATALSVLQNQIAVLEKENAFLRAQIIQFGIDAAASGSQSSSGTRQLLNLPLAQSLLNSVSQSPQAATAISTNATATSAAASVLPSTPPTSVGVNLSPQNQNQLAAQQLLISLAQSLTNSPLLTSQSPSTPSSSSSLAQPVTTSPSSTQLTAAHLPQVTPGTPSRLNAASATPPPPPPSATNTNIVTSAVSTPSSQQQQQPFQQSQLPQSLLNTSAPSLSLSSTTPGLGSLVQTLASLAGTTITASPSPVPKASLPSVVSPMPASQPPPAAQTSVATGGLSAAAAASLLNTLILAQNVLTGGGGGGAGGGASQGSSVLGDSSSVLSSIGLETVAGSDHTTQQ